MAKVLSPEAIRGEVRRRFPAVAVALESHLREARANTSRAEWTTTCYRAQRCCVFLVKLTQLHPGIHEPEFEVVTTISGQAIAYHVRHFQLRWLRGPNYLRVDLDGAKYEMFTDLRGKKRWQPQRGFDSLLYPGILALFAEFF